MKWNNIPDTMPPGDAGRFSPRVWLALPDGKVMPGTCLHSVAGEPAAHASWHLEPMDGQPCHQTKMVPVAWAVIVSPAHPSKAKVIRSR